MGYSKQTWQDLPDTTTPVTASRLNHIEDGIEANDVNGIVVNATEPSTDRRKVWVQKGKNLFDGILRQGNHVNTTTTNRLCNSNPIKAKGGAYYTVSTNLPDTYSVKLMNCVSNALDSTIINDGSWGHTSANVYCGQDGYLKVLVKKDDDSNLTPSTVSNYHFMVEQGTTATTYEAYIEPKIYVKNNNNIYEDIDFLQSLQGVVLWTSDSTGAKGEMQLDIDLTNFEAYQVLYNAWNNMLPNNLIATGKLLKEYPYLLINFTGHYRRVWYDASTKKIEISAIDGGSEASYDSVPFKIIGFKKF